MNSDTNIIRAKATTPRAAAIAGILFSVLLIISLVLIRLSVPANPQGAGTWLTEGWRNVNLALNLVPFAGIAFLWFIGVVRDRRIQNHPKFCDGGPPKNAPRLSPTPHPLVKKAVEAVAGVDPSVLFSWLGDGGEPVSKEKANARAGVCAGWDKGSKCPGNVSKGWRDLLTAPAAEWIRLTLEAKHQMDLSTDYDDQLGVCKFCRCHLGLKAFVPIEHIRDNTDPEDLQKLDTNCWVLSELK